MVAAKDRGHRELDLSKMASKDHGLHDRLPISLPTISWPLRLGPRSRLIAVVDSQSSVIDIEVLESMRARSSSEGP